MVHGGNPNIHLYIYIDKENVIYTQWNIVQSLKRKKNLLYATKWMSLKDIIASEISQSQKGKFCLIPLI